MIISDERAWDSYRNVQSCRGVIFLNPMNMKNSLLIGLVLRYTEVTCSLVIPWLCYIYAHQCQCLDVKYTLAFSPSFLLLYSLKTSSNTPNFSYFKTNNDFGKPTRRRKSKKFCSLALIDLISQSKLGTKCS
jgi:hypothetical protein